jgi:outer membrane lipoprotein-sorting protein
MTEKQKHRLKIRLLKPRGLSMVRFRIPLYGLMIFCLAITNSKGDDTALINKIVSSFDELYKSSASYAVIEMEITTPHWARTLKMKTWSLGMEKMLVKILAPKKERGVGTLKIEDEMWNYLPKTNKVIKVPPSMMMSSWMGSDFTNDDLVREFTFVKDYDFRLIRSAGAHEGLVYLEARPKPGVPVVWTRVVIAVRESSLLPVWEEYYGERGQLFRRIDFSDIRRFGRREVPAVMELVPANKEGHKTILRYKSIEFDAAVDPEVMTMRHLRSGG